MRALSGGSVAQLTKSASHASSVGARTQIQGPFLPRGSWQTREDPRRRASHSLVPDRSLFSSQSAWRYSGTGCSTTAFKGSAPRAPPDTAARQHQRISTALLASTAPRGSLPSHKSSSHVSTGRPIAPRSSSQALVGATC